MAADAHPTLPGWLKLPAGLSTPLCLAFAVSVVPGVRGSDGSALAAG